MAITLHDPAGQPSGPGGQAVQPQQTPSERMIAEANALKYVTDAKKRRLGYRRWNALERFRMTRVMKADATNDQLMLLTEITTSVREIDGTPQGFPSAYSQIEAMVVLVGEEGQTAVMQDWVKEAQGEAGEAPQSDLDLAKNSQGTVG
jgi:hypothetical protein